MKMIPTWQGESLPRFHRTAVQDCTGLSSYIYIYIYIR